MDLHFAHGSSAGLTDQALIAILLDRLEYKLKHAPDGPDSVDKAWEIALQCLMALPAYDE